MKLLSFGAMALMVVGTQAWSVISTNPNDLNGSAVTPNDVVTGATTTLSSVVSECIPSTSTPVSWIRLAYCNYRNDEQSVGNALTISVNILIEGVYAPIAVTFGGASSVAIPDLGKVLSDPVNVGLLPPGTRYRVECTYSVANSAMFVPGGFRVISLTPDGFTTFGEGVWAGSFAVRGDIQLASTLNVYSHSMVLGCCSCKSFANIGDSIFDGTGGASIRQGQDGPAVRFALQQLTYAYNTATVPYCGWVDLAKGGAKLTDVLSNYSIRGWLASFCRDVMCNLATNDLGVSTLADVKTNSVNWALQWTRIGKKYIKFPLLPRTSSTDGWYTVANQTAAGSVSDRASYLAWQLDPAGMLADFVAAGGNAGLFYMISDRTGWAVDSGGSPSNTGTFFPASPVVIASGTVNDSNQLTSSTSRDTTKAAVTQNLYRGRMQYFKAGAVGNPKAAQCVRYNASSGTIGTNAFNNVHVLNDPYDIVSGVYTADGTHPSSEFSALIAATFSTAWLR